MKKYAVLDKDLSLLIGEINAYLATKNIDSEEYKLQLYHPAETAENLIDNIPTIDTAFSDEELTVKGIGHYQIDNFKRGIPVPVSYLIIPLSNTENSVLDILSVDPDALPYKDFIINHDYYDIYDCEILETVEFNNPILVNVGTIYSIRNTSDDLAHFALLGFNEDVSSFFAE